MAWAPDGTLFYAEKELGNVRMVVDGVVVPASVAHVEVDVTTETGLLGLAVDPGWPDEPWLYLYYSDASDGNNRLIRVRVEDGREVEREKLLDGLPTAAAYHNGGDMVFGLDGMLYLTVGDAHELERALDPSDLGGKVLRLAPDGSIPLDNPIPGTRTLHDGSPQLVRSLRRSRNRRSLGDGERPGRWGRGESPRRRRELRVAGGHGAAPR